MYLKYSFFFWNFWLLLSVLNSVWFDIWLCSVHKHYIHRLHLPAHTTVAICTIAILGLATAESLQRRWGQLLVNKYINPKLIFMTLSTSIYPISVTFSTKGQHVFEADFKNGFYSRTSINFCTGYNGEWLLFLWVNSRVIKRLDLSWFLVCRAVLQIFINFLSITIARASGLTLLYKNGSNNVRAIQVKKNPHRVSEYTVCSWAKICFSEDLALQ